MGDMLKRTGRWPVTSAYIQRKQPRDHADRHATTSGGHRRVRMIARLCGFDIHALHVIFLLCMVFRISMIRPELRLRFGWTLKSFGFGGILKLLKFYHQPAAPH
jgi:hypothetical protein